MSNTFKTDRRLYNLNNNELQDQDTIIIDQPIQLKAFNSVTIDANNVDSVKEFYISLLKEK